MANEEQLKRLQEGGIKEWNTWYMGEWHKNSTSADLSNANLEGMNLCDGYFRRVDLRYTNLRNCMLMGTNLCGANLLGADLTNVALFETMFCKTNLHNAIGLKSCRHLGPSGLDPLTCMLSNSVPREFMQGCGWLDNLIETIMALRQSVPGGEEIIRL